MRFTGLRPHDRVRVNPEEVAGKPGFWDAVCAVLSRLSLSKPWGMYSMKLKGVWGASLVMVALAASSCDEEQSAPPSEPTPAAMRTTRQEANSTRKVLILGSSVSGGEDSLEALMAAEVDSQAAIHVVTPEQWSAMTASQFMEYKALVIGDAACQEGTAAFQAAIDNRNVWGAIVDGAVVIVGANPASNAWDSSYDQFVLSSLELAMSRPTKTGMYISLGCSYQNAPPNTHVELLEPFGEFQVGGVGCAEYGHVFSMYPGIISDWVWDGMLQGPDGCSARTVFTSYPTQDFSIAAMALDNDPDNPNLPGSWSYYDYDWDWYYSGTPFMLTRGTTAVGLGCGGDPDRAPSDEECDLGDNGNGQPALQDPPEPTCSWTCKTQWCGDGVVQDGEECDMGRYNGRSLSGQIGTCTAFCKFPNLPPPADHPPVALCQDVSVNLTATCGAYASIDNGSYDEDNDLEGCTQSPPMPYGVGQTLVTLTCADAAGNVAECTGTVTVTDSIRPTVALVGQASQTLECATPYTDPGATANDYCEGDLSHLVTVTGSVNSGVPATYTLRYGVTDSSGNPANPVTRTVTVTDTQKPTITLNGLANEGLECGNPYTDPGATAADACYGNLTSAIVRTGAVNANQPNTYVLRYNVTDPKGNVATEKSRTVTVSDTLAPEVTVNGPLNLPVECGDGSYTDPGATANDQCAGVLPTTASTVVDPGNPGTFTITYSATDPSGNTGTSATGRTVTVSDNLAPVLTLLGDATQALECATPYTDPGATANDQCAGDLTASIVTMGAVDTMEPGSYPLTYTVSDPAGLSASANRTVNVSDTLAPEVTVNGPLNLPVECGDGTYTDPGASASDACAGPLPAVPSTVVDPGNPGTFTITYSATDPSGNTGTSATGRTVTVSDNLPPTLTLNGAGAQALECATPYTDPGATASDQCAGDLTDAIVTTGSVNNMEPGSYQLDYNVQDPAGLSASASRTVNVSDTLAPEVTVNGPLNLPVECGDGTYTDPGASASDACAGPLPAVPSTVVDPGNPGTFTITYSATDPSGNTGTSATGRTVTVSDNLPPTLALLGDATQAQECGSPYTDPGATANDQCAGDLTGSIVRTGGVNTGVVGAYQLTYNVQDPAGQSAPSVTRTVNVDDTLAPTINVNGPTTDSFECGDTYVDPGATANDQCAGDLTAAIVATQTGDPGQPGTFTITYSVEDPSGNSTTSPVVRTVTVDDNEPPTLVLNGDATQALECGDGYTDPGASAQDACFGDVTDRIVVSGTVNTGAPGSYTLTYDVTDQAGQSAPSVNRTVTVADTQAPTVTVDGPLNVQVECGSGGYADPGATANDACAGTLPATPSTVVDPDAPGTFVISYSATDPSGNTGTSATGRTVTVEDTLPPTLALLGPGTQALECATPYTDPGATANDQCAGDISGLITRTGSVNEMQVGSYELTYNVTDPSGQSAPAVTRTVNVSDTQGPSIMVQGPLNDTFECGGTYVDPGATANDACAGDLTAAIVAEQAGNPDQPGTFTITYSVEDPSGNSTTSPVVRTVTVDDNEPPTMVLNGDATQSLECGDAYTDPGASAQDACFGDVTGRIVTTGTVDTGTPGSYTLTYNVTDQAGQSAPTLNRTVNVSDTLAPSISVNGPLSQTFECGGTYTDPGATANDACAGDLSGAIVVTGAVNEGAAGTYTLSYSVTDPSGNTATAASSRTVTVTDTSAPIIALNGDATQALECGTPFVDPGATANDACVGDLTAAIVTTGTVNSGVAGSYTIDYSVTDPSGQSASTSRTVNVSDTQAPTLTLVGAATQSVECGSSYVDPGAEATDLCAGDLDGAVVVSGSVNAGAVGTYSVTYNVQDPSGNAAPEVSRTVNVGDTLAPTINVNGPLDQTFECGSTYVDPGATASDQCAGDLTAAIVAEQSGNPDQPGTFTITYSVEDPSGNSTTSPVVRTVTVDDNAPPTLVLNGDATQSLECGTPFVDPGAAANDACFGDVTGSITVSGTVNHGAPGSYTLIYNVVDPAGQAAPSVSRTVNVSDTQAPAITVQGPLNQTYECGTTYVDPGATALDACAGDLTAEVVATETPIPGQPGSVSISYSVTDPAGNTATAPVTRTVTMQDDEAPSISLNGPPSMVLECGNPFEDPGAEAIDQCVGEVPVIVSGSVDTTTAGTYTLSYVAQDSVGNTSPTVQRTVTVTDNAGPTITIIGDNPMRLECNRDEYVELGATANDLCSGDLPVTTDSSAVNESVTGFYPVYYTATDNSGLTTQALRNVLVEDNLAPTLTLNDPNPMVLECALDTFNDPGGMAIDLCEGDVSSSIFVEFTDLNLNAEGNYIARYQASDSVGHTVQATRNLTVQDTTPPTLTVLSETETIECGTQPTLGVTATDACYGPVPVVATPAAVPAEPGEYQVFYTAMDPARNVSAADAVSRTIIVEDTTAPELSLQDQNIYYECTGHAIGNVWEAPTATATDTCGGSIPVHQYNTGDDDEDGVPGSVDPDDFGPGPTTEVEGLYYVQYLAWDESYNIQGAILSVYVTDTLKPVMGLNGDAAVQLECYNNPEENPDPYVDAGAWAEDQCYGDLTPSVLTFGEVNGQVPGVYTLEYQVRDGAYNWADPLARTVEVVDTFQPLVTGNPPIKVWPADGLMRTVQLSECAVAIDQCDGYMAINENAVITSITSDEPGEDAGDIIIIDNSTFQVRAEASPSGNGRVYRVEFAIADSSGNETTSTVDCKVYVPLNEDDPPQDDAFTEFMAGR